MQLTVLCQFQTSRSRLLISDSDEIKQNLHRQNIFLRGFKLTLLLLLLSCLQVAAENIEQVTFSGKNVPLEKIFEAIKNQTGYLFFYNSDAIRNAKPVTIDVKNMPVNEVLRECLREQPFDYTIENKTIFIITKINDRKPSVEYITQQGDVRLIDVKGRVVNESGSPVAGVTVMVKGTSVSTTTDAEGQFELSTIDKDALLVFTHVSMETFELRVSGKSDLVVRLKTKINELGDVTVTVTTGYEDVPKERATGSFVKVDKETLNQQVGTNILDRLVDVTSGLSTINKSDNNRKLGISIRGLSSINGPLDPLIVLDGFIYEGDINNINPNDVENVTILRDAAAASIWGTRAGNGVIVITTKRSQFDKKLEVEFNSNVIFGEKPDFAKMHQMSTSDYINVEEMLFNSGYFDSQISGSPWEPLTPAVAVFLKRRNGVISSADSATSINALKSGNARDEYLKYVYTNPITQQYYANVSGGSNVNAYTFSIGYDKILTDLHAENQKLNVKVENIFRPVKNLNIRLGVYYTNGKATSGKNGYNNTSVAGRQIPYYNLVDENGNPQPLNIPGTFDNEYVLSIGNGKLLDWQYYPLEEYKHSRSVSELQEIFATVGIQYKIFPFLKLNLYLQHQKQQLDATNLYDLGSFFTRNMINSFSQINSSTGEISYIVPLGSMKTGFNSMRQSSTGRFQMDFNRSWQEHEISAIAGAEARQAQSTGSDYTYFGYNEDPLTFANVDHVNSYPHIITGDYTTITGAPTPASELTDRFVSVYANAAYVWKRRYTLSASARRDGSNIFGLSTNDKWKPLWSAGIGWNISNEQFYKSEWLPHLKFRATYGFTGNVDLSKSAIPVATYSTTSVTNLAFARIRTINNPELRWEQVKIINVGFDFSLKKEILSGSIEFYRKNGTDLYAPSFYDYTTWGFGNTITRNVADMKGSGIDVILNSKNINRAVSWNTNLILSYHTEKTTKYFTTQSSSILSAISGGGQINPIVGKPLYAIAAYKWGGLDNSGNPQGFVNGELSTDYTAIFTEANAKGTDGNVVYVGSAVPTLYGSIINMLSWHGFSFSANISFKMGYYFRKPSISYRGLVESGIGHPDFEKRWQKVGDEATTNIPSFEYPVDENRDNFFNLSEANVFKGDHIRLQYLTLSYTINKQNWKRWPLKNTRLYINVENLGILWRANNEGLDPENPLSLPPSRIYAIGIRGTL